MGGKPMGIGRNFLHLSLPLFLHILLLLPILGTHWWKTYGDTPIFKSPSEFEVQEVMNFGCMANSTGNWLTKVKAQNHIRKFEGYIFGNS